MRHFVIPETFFKSIAEKGKLYSRLWFYWLSEFVDELFEPEFLEKMLKNKGKVEKKTNKKITMEEQFAAFDAAMEKYMTK